MQIYFLHVDRAPVRNAGPSRRHRVLLPPASPLPHGHFGLREDMGNSSTVEVFLHCRYCFHAFPGCLIGRHPRAPEDAPLVLHTSRGRDRDVVSLLRRQGCLLEPRDAAGGQEGSADAVRQRVLHAEGELGELLRVLLAHVRVQPRLDEPRFCGEPRSSTGSSMLGLNFGAGHPPQVRVNKTLFDTTL